MLAIKLYDYIEFIYYHKNIFCSLFLNDKIFVYF